MGILSIQSLVAYGHAGNSAALFPLQRLGKVVWPVMTVHFSNHTGYGAWRGPLLSADDVAEVILGVEERGAFAECEAVLTGYQGDEDVGAVVLDAVARVKSASPSAIYCCDPVMGDVGRGMFVRPGIPELMRDRVVPAAETATRSRASSGVSSVITLVTRTVPGPVARTTSAAASSSSYVVVVAPARKSSSKWFGVITSAAGTTWSRMNSGMPGRTNIPRPTSPITGSQQ